MELSGKFTYFSSHLGLPNSILVHFLCNPANEPFTTSFEVIMRQNIHVNNITSLFIWSFIQQKASKYLLWTNFQAKCVKWWTKLVWNLQCSEQIIYDSTTNKRYYYKLWYVLWKNTCIWECIVGKLSFSLEHRLLSSQSNIELKAWRKDMV